MLPILFCALLCGCPKPGPADGGEPFECTVSAPTSCEQPQLRWVDVQPVVQKNCGPCHDGSGDQWPLNSYTDVADWADTVRDWVADCSMPPQDAGIPMTDAEKLVILDWLRCGFMQ
jgi:hypothetical protein